MTTGELDKRQNIIFSDSILNLNKLGKNTKITSISSIEPHELQTCLKTIIENNSNVEINAIQYSQGFKKIFFYANKKVDITSWLKNECDSNELIQKLKNASNESSSLEMDEISINTVLSFLQEITEKQEIIKNNFKSKIDTKLKEKFGQGYYSNIYGMNYKTKELTLDISNITNYYKHSFVKNNDVLYISEAETFEYTGEILDTIGEELLELYNWLLTLEQFYIQEVNNIKTNNDFLVKIDRNEIKITLKKEKKTIFVMQYSFSSKKMYYQCKDWNAIQIVKKNENKFLDKIFIKIEDTPLWMQNILKEKRKQQLQDIQKQDNNSFKIKILSLLKKM